jgi:hypothetical protein
MNASRAERTWLAFTFDGSCRRTSSNVLFDPFDDAARTLFNASLDVRHGYDIAAAVLCSPEIAPSDLKEIISDVASVKLPYNISRLLLPCSRLLWNAREAGT